MRSLIKTVRRFFGSDEGPAAVEYAVMLGLLLLAGVSAAQSIGCNLNKPIRSTSEAIAK